MQNTRSTRTVHKSIGAKLNPYFVLGFNEALLGLGWNHQYDSWEPISQLNYEKARQAIVHARACGLEPTRLAEGIVTWEFKALQAALIARGERFQIDRRFHQPPSPGLAFAPTLDRRGWPLPVKTTVPQRPKAVSPDALGL